MKIIKMNSMRDKREGLSKFEIRICPGDIIPTDAEIIGEFTIDSYKTGVHCFLTSVEYDVKTDEYIAKYTSYGNR